MTEHSDRFQPFTFAVITDLHVGEDGPRGVKRIEAIIEAVNQNRDIEFVLALGDYTPQPTLEGAVKILSKLKCPCRAVAGNHDADKLEGFRASFGPLYYSFEHGGWLFVGLWNALPAIECPEDHTGRMDPPQVRWTEEVLAGSTSENPSCRGTILFGHVPPRAPGRDDYYRRMTEEDHEKFADWCRRYSIEAAFFGHHHFDDVFRIGPTEVIVTPSCNWNFDMTGGVQTKGESSGYRVVRVTARAIEHRAIWLT